MRSCLLAVVAFLVLGTMPSLAQNTCDAGKLKCMCSKAGCIVKVHEKAIKTGEAPDGVKIGICQAKFEDPATGCVAKLEAKQNSAKPASVCSIVGNAAFLEASVDTCIASALAGLGSPAGPSTCDSGKLKCMRKKAGCLLKVHEKSVQTGLPPDDARLALCQLKFEDSVKGCIAKLEAKQDPTKPATVCTTVDNTAALEDVVDACTMDLVDAVTTCPADVASPEGLTATGAQLFHQDIAGIDDACEVDDRFGSSLVTGDFDGDGYADLAIGIPSELFIGGSSIRTGPGELAVLYGAQNGLYGTSRDQVLTSAFGLNFCGTMLMDLLAAGDFNGDGRDDVAIVAIDCGSNPPQHVWIVEGSPSGLVSSLAQSPILAGIQAVTTGEFNGDAYGDLVMMAQYDFPHSDGGFRLLLVPGSPSGLDWPSRSRITNLIPFNIEVLARGDFDANPIDDLVVGYPGSEQIELRLNPFTPAESTEVWNQNNPGMVGAVETGDRFGDSLAVGDFNGDGFDDVAVGVPGEDATFTDQGAFHRIFGDGSGLTATGNQLFGASAPLPGARYGTALAAGRFDTADTAHELAAGAPLHAIDQPNGGYVDVRFGSATTNQWSQNAAGIPGDVELNDNFGDALAVGDFNGDGADDLAIGVPGEGVGSVANAGAVNVLYGTPSQCLP